MSDAVGRYLPVLTSATESVDCSELTAEQVVDLFELDESVSSGYTVCINDIPFALTGGKPERVQNAPKKRGKKR